MITKDPAEVRIPASRTSDGVLIERGELVVTNNALMFRPRRNSDEHLAWQRRSPAGIPHTPIVVAVRTGASGRLSCPPTLVVEDADGRSVEFAVLGHPWSPNWSARNRAARDRAVMVLASVLD